MRMNMYKRKLRTNKKKTMRVNNKPKHSLALCIREIKLSTFVFLMDFAVYMEHIGHFH